MEPDPAQPHVVARLAAYARRVDPRRAGPPVVLAHRTGELVVRCGDIVVKRHAENTDRAALAARLAAATAPALSDVLLTPLDHDDLDGRAVTAWPLGRALRPDEVGEAPWEAAADLLARMHQVPLPPGLPAAGGPIRVARAIRRLAAVRGVRADLIRAAYATLPASSRGAAPPSQTLLTHGDWHLGQIVRTTAGAWRLIDVDDIGYGEPAWDLARLAAWQAADLLPGRSWHRFLGAYRAAGGPAVPPTGDPWPALDPASRALTVQIAALAVCNAELDVAEAVVACCRRIVRLDADTTVRGLSRLLNI